MFSIFVVYSVLVSTALFAFGHELHDASLYTFSFNDFAWMPVAIFLELFPVFTLSSNYPLITITLRNSIRPKPEPISPKKKTPPFFFVPNIP